MAKRRTAVQKYLSDLGKKGGKAATGAAKARDPEKMREAANKRWAKAQEKSQTEDKPHESR